MSLPLTVSCFSKIQIGFTFLVLAHWVVTEKGLLNGCECVCVIQFIDQPLWNQFCTYNAACIFGYVIALIRDYPLNLNDDVQMIEDVVGII